MIGALFPTGSLFADGADLVSRQTSAENPTGAPGAGCAAAPSPDDPDLVHSAPAVDLGRGFKVRPYVRLEAGATLELADVEGPGAISHLYLTSNLADLNSLRLRCHWDGDHDAAIDVPLGHFFALGHAPPCEVRSFPITVGPGRGCSSFWPMPFVRNALVTLTNEGAEAADVVAYAVAYTLGELRDPTLRLHATFAESTTSTSCPDHVIIDVDDTAGSYVGTALAWTAHQPGWWGEGQVKFYVDGDDLPSIVGSGTEDYFGGAWAFGQDAVHVPGPHGLTAQPFNSAFLGCPLLETDDATDRRISLYRWHLPDPVHFRRDLRVTVQALGWGDDGRYRVRDDHIASVAYWYRRRR